MWRLSLFPSPFTSDTWQTDKPFMNCGKDENEVLTIKTRSKQKISEIWTIRREIGRTRKKKTILTLEGEKMLPKLKRSEIRGTWKLKRRVRVGWKAWQLKVSTLQPRRNAPPHLTTVEHLFGLGGYEWQFQGEMDGGVYGSMNEQW